jgi:insecticidal toxin complex protein TccC
MDTMTLHAFTPTLAVTEPRGLVARSVAWYRTDIAESLHIRVNRSAFDAAGRVVQQWDPRLWAEASENASAPANLVMVYSLTGHLLGSDSVDAGWRVGLFGEAGQAQETWDGRGFRRRHAYDALLRPTTLFETSNEQAERCVERFDYGTNEASVLHNQLGQLIRHDDQAGSRLISGFGLTGAVLELTQHFLSELQSPDWPDAGRDEMWESGAGATSTWRYNSLGNLLAQTDAQGNSQLYAHTVAGQLKGSALQLKGQPPRPIVGDISYDAQGRVESETLGNGVISTSRYRENDGRLTQLSAQRSNGEVLRDLHYDYDPLGNVIRIEDSSQSTRFFANQRIEPVSTYRYDTLNQLIEATGRETASVNHGPLFPVFHTPPDSSQLANYTQTYGYDAAGNLQKLTHVGAQNHSRTLITAHYSNRSLPQLDDQPPTEADIANGFDENGNLRQLQPGQPLEWDSGNQLQQVRPVVRESGNDDSERYIYDASGQRVRKVRISLAKAVTHRSEVRYLPGLEVRTNTATGEVLQVITAQAGRSEVRVLHWEAGKPEGIDNNQYRYSQSDHLGSRTLELDHEAQLISQESYYPFGGTACWAGRDAVEANYKIVRYSGKERDATGLYYYGLRYYAPWLQRWINPDPAGEVADTNLYKMVGNNPLRFYDSAGLNGEDVNDSGGGGWESTAAGHADSTRNLNNIVSRMSANRASHAPGFDMVTNTLSMAEAALGFLNQTLFRPSYSKYVIADYPDFTIKHFELHSPLLPKELMVVGHGRLRSNVHKIYDVKHILNFYAPRNHELVASSNDLHMFQSRKINVDPVEVINVGGDSSDYELQHSPEFYSPLASFMHQGQLLNRKPEIRSTDDLYQQNYHDVLTVKPGKAISLSKVLRQAPNYSQVHGLFCRLRRSGGLQYDPFG